MKRQLNLLFRKITFSGLSIQQRLPLLICVLLCSIVLTFSFASYYAVKKGALDTGKQRVRLLTNNFASMLAQSYQSLTTAMLGVVKQNSIKTHLLSGGFKEASETHTLLNKLKRDTSWVLIELLDSTKKPVLQLGDTTAANRLNLQTIFADQKPAVNTCTVGKIYAFGNTMYYPVLACVTDSNNVIGYLVSWRLISSSPQENEQLYKLLGPGAALLVGNADGSVWTNLMKPIAAPQLNNAQGKDYFTYNNEQGKDVIAAVQQIPGTVWQVLVEFSIQNLVEPATRFLNWIFIADLLLIAIGILITWAMSRNITRPLNELCASATAIAAGERTALVKSNRLDELGKLVNAFNIMAEKIQLTQSDLEKKVKDRTLKLEAAKNEMESFSYSVSHDLRAPLRAVIGFATILEEDYASRLDDEAKRICATIKKDAVKMGHLIDDLLAFSKLGRHSIAKTIINSNKMVKEVVESMNSDTHINWNIEPLPDIKGDATTIRQVWFNLVSNAVKYSQTRVVPTIHIGAIAKDNQVTFFVKDNGVGFDQKYASKLFKVFQRLHTAEEFEGTGIGLAIVEKIITKHGGTVSVTAGKDKGAVFYFTLPAEQQGSPPLIRH